MTKFRKIKLKRSKRKKLLLLFVLASLLFVSGGYAIVNSNLGFLGTLFVNPYENKSTIQKFSNGDKTKFRSDTYREKIETVTLSESISPPEGYIEDWNLDVEDKGKVKAYITKRSDTDVYDLYIQGDGNLYANPNSSYLFHNLKGLKEIINLNILNTSEVTNMSSMFYYCSSLTGLDLSNFDTSKVVDMSYTFSYCNGLTSLDVSGFDTSKVTSMYMMFSNCSGLTSLDVSKFDTSNVTGMGMIFMFGGCSNLTSLDVSSFDTSKVIYLNSMFSNCSELITLNLSNFNTSNIMYMNQVFYGCRSLTSLDLSGFDTSNVTDFGNMFSGCSSLTSLDVSEFDTSKATKIHYMFSDCIKLASLDVSNFNTSSVTSMNGMFSGCSGLTSLDLSGFDASNVTDISYMFSYCSNLATIYVNSKWNVANVTNGVNMFYGCGKIVGQSGVIYDSSKVDVTMANYTTGYLSLRTWNFDFTNDYQTFTVPYNGTYKIEAWGAQGGKQTAAGRGGYGGYVSGDIFLTAKDNLYIYVGQNSGWGNSFNAYPEYRPGFPGGGASDIRLQPGDKWYDFDSLKSRIMVAGGGGGSEWDYSIGGDGGGLIGYTGYGAEWGSSSTPTTIRSTGGTQTSGGVSEDDRSTKTPGDSGGFGYAGYSTTSTDYGGLGGGGYYGGASKDAAYAGGGGSSFISGHDGCNAITASSTESNIIHTGSSNHYSGYSFSNTVMIDGQGCSWTTVKGLCNGQIQPTGETSTTGHTGSGYVRITFLY